MRYKWDPVSKGEMEKEKPWCTICETLRQVYKRTEDEESKLLLRIATQMAKSMQRKLIKYGVGMEKKDWDKTKDVIK